jgi:hypothetical protein
MRRRVSVRVQPVASRHAFPTCRGRGRNGEGDLADWTGSILTDIWQTPERYPQAG